jgi:dihydrofolate synthase/folylpolyglutamate synthase
LQKLENTSWNALLQPTQELWIDGGHNDSAGHALATQVNIWEDQQDNKPLVIIAAMVKRKDPCEFIAPLLPYAAQIICTEIPNEDESFKAKDLYDALEPLALKNDYPALSCTSNMSDALNRVSLANARILCTGSLYFMGHLLSE